MDDSPHEDFGRIRPPLEGRLVRLRAIEDADIPAINRMFNDPDVLRFLSAVTFPLPVAATREWRDSCRHDERVVAFAIETLPGELVGVCDLRELDGRTRTATLGIWVGRPYWDQGLGTDAVRTLCRFGFEEMNLQRVTLYVSDRNERGVRAYEKVGFRSEGVLRRAHFAGGRHEGLVAMGLLAEEITPG
jgi:RimJ/RimL family protein N-acetyltransferase